MTKVGQLFEDEKIRAVKEATAKVTEEATAKALKQGLSVEAIADILSLTIEEVLEIQEKICTPV